MALAMAAMVVAAAVAGSAKVAGPAPKVSAGPRVEVAFVLDTTGSISGLIEGAKRRIWSIARRIGEGRPRPELRIALVGYRDVGDVYVTRVHPFSADLDEVYQSLSSFRAEGGGDTPEHVSAALRDAVEKLPWSSSDGQVLKVIFLVGDAPPHTDYQDGFDYRRHVADARARGIIVDAIQCGGDPRTAAVWTEVATLGLGNYARIDADGGMNAAVTPYDAELARLGAELSSTVVISGRADERAKTAGSLAARAAMPAAVAAEAAGYYGSGVAVASNDLVDKPVAQQRQELSAGNAPALAGKSEADALKDLAERKAKREQLQKKIQEVQKKRDAALREAEGAPKDGFDAEVVAKLKERAAKVGIAY